jgi:hypothetical protein
MYFDTIEIRPKAFGKKGWEVRHSQLRFDRQPGPGSMSDLGFYHYPRRKGKKKAFEELKAHMIKRHEDEIFNLLRSLDELKKLEMK